MTFVQGNYGDDRMGHGTVTIIQGMYRDDRPGHVPRHSSAATTMTIVWGMYRENSEGDKSTLLGSILKSHFWQFVVIELTTFERSVDQFLVFLQVFVD